MPSPDPTPPECGPWGRGRPPVAGRAPHDRDGGRAYPADGMAHCEPAEFVPDQTPFDDDRPPPRTASKLKPLGRHLWRPCCVSRITIVQTASPCRFKRGARDLPSAGARRADEAVGTVTIAGVSVQPATLIDQEWGGGGGIVAPAGGRVLSTHTPSVETLRANPDVRARSRPPPGGA